MMLLRLNALSFQSLSLNNTESDPTAWQGSRWWISTDPNFAPGSTVLDTWVYGDYAGSPWTSADAMAANPAITALALENITFDAEIGEELYIRLYQQDSLGFVGEPGETTLSALLRPLERAWAFNLDGHIFYVMNYVLQHALIYDVASRQWHRWFTKDASLVGGEPFWNMFRGVVWNGRVLAADVGLPSIWEVDPHSMLDEEALPIERAVTGFQPLRGSASIRQGSLRVTARKEDAAVPATVSLRFSDDNGRTWSAPRTVLLAANSYSQRLEFRSLGRIRAPGRVWEISDSGGFVRIDGADADLEGES